jgi:hypothetical protein
VALLGSQAATRRWHRQQCGRCRSSGNRWLSGRRHPHVRTFTTMTDELLALCDWLSQPVLSAAAFPKLGRNRMPRTQSSVALRSEMHCQNSSVEPSSTKRQCRARSPLQRRRS